MRKALKIKTSLEVKHRMLILIGLSSLLFSFMWASLQINSDM